jgi:hypothetical protein
VNFHDPMCGQGATRGDEGRGRGGLATRRRFPTSASASRRQAAAAPHGTPKDSGRGPHNGRQVDLRRRPAFGSAFPDPTAPPRPLCALSPFPNALSFCVISSLVSSGRRSRCRQVAATRPQAAECGGIGRDPTATANRVVTHAKRDIAPSADSGRCALAHGFRSPSARSSKFGRSLAKRCPRRK